MSLTNNSRGIYVNLKRGRFAIKVKNKNGEDSIELYENLTGRIVGVQFKDESYNGQDFLVAVFEIVDNVDTYLLQIRVDSGYFRTLCNSLKSGDVNRIVKLSAMFTDAGGKTKTVMFVKQDGKTLKHFHTQDKLGDLPPLEKVTYKGKERYDGTNQQKYWMDWLSSINFGDKEEEKKIINEEISNSDYEATDEFDGEMPF